MNLKDKLPNYKAPAHLWAVIETQLEDTVKPHSIFSKTTIIIITIAIMLLSSFSYLVLSTPIPLTPKIEAAQVKAASKIETTYTEEIAEKPLNVPQNNTEEGSMNEYVESLCKAQPAKCNDEYVEGLKKQIQDLTIAGQEVSAEEASVQDDVLVKQKARIEKEKAKTLRKLKKYLNKD